ncbi:MAG: trypsin-like serine protease [Rhodococcus sp.]|nr:trypsin-like serine protease [Rhodococcus sp. (in: high G+C Gram-positive bacteria)]
MTGSRTLRLTVVAVMTAAATLIVGAPTLGPASLPVPAAVSPTVPPNSAPPPAPTRPILAPDQLERAVVPTIVAITSDSVTTSTAGTGIILTADGLVVTNHHVIVGATAVSARSFDTGTSYEAEVLGYDAGTDIAVLRLADAANLTPATIGDHTNIRIGEPVTAIGNAEGDGAAVSARGAVTGLEQVLTARSTADGSRNRLDGMIEVNAAVRPGDSGGPLVDDTGAVIGINTAGNAESDPAEPVATPRSYAVPIDVAMGVVDQVRSGTSSDTVRVGPTPVLGVTVTDHARGAEVLWVSLWGPAEDAGMEVGDVITTMDGRRISSAQEITAMMMQRGPGDTIELGWIDREGAVHTGRIMLEEGPPN